MGLYWFGNPRRIRLCFGSFESAAKEYCHRRSTAASDGLTELEDRSFEGCTCEVSKVDLGRSSIDLARAISYGLWASRPMALGQWQLGQGKFQRIENIENATPNYKNVK